MESSSVSIGVKRSASEDEQFTSSKRARLTKTSIKHHRLNVRQPGHELLFDYPQDATLIEQQLRRSICVALYAAGFSAAQPDAVEELLAATEEYMHHFTRQVAHSMQFCRRSQPIPQDFIHALSRSHPHSFALEADLNLAIPVEVTQLPILPPSQLDLAEFNCANIFDQHESDLKDKDAHRYIPAHFPSFPSEHTFRSTPVFTSRENDARKIREKATEEGMEAEKALRKLMAASKATAGNRRRVGGDRQRQEREDVWRETLAAVAAEDKKSEEIAREDSVVFGLDGAGDLADEVLEVAEVNYDRMFWRRG